MAKMNDYGIRFISHGCWSDPEIEWKKSDYQKLLFNYWDVEECTEYGNLCDSEDDNDLRELVSQISELAPSEYACPDIYYEWCVDGEYDDSDYFKDFGLTLKEDYVLHNTSQALRQALAYIEHENMGTAEIRIYRSEHGKCTTVADYRLQGATLKDVLH